MEELLHGVFWEHHITFGVSLPTPCKRVYMCSDISGLTLNYRFPGLAASTKIRSSTLKFKKEKQGEEGGRDMALLPTYLTSSERAMQQVWPKCKSTHMFDIFKELNGITFWYPETTEMVKLPAIIILAFPKVESPVKAASKGHAFTLR